MRIGIDFDNTIARYDGVFHAAALERDLIPDGIGTDKNSIRDFLNGLGMKDAFTELQGYVYGSRMALASPYPGIAEFLARARLEGHSLFIISHKTRYPLLGPKFDMHEAAREFLRDNGLVGETGNCIPENNVYFENTKEEKMARADELRVNVFVDDLPDVLAIPGINNGVRKILFDPKGQHNNEKRFERARDWTEIADLALGESH